MLLKQVRMGDNYNMFRYSGHGGHRPIEEPLSGNNMQLLRQWIAHSRTLASGHHDCDDLHASRLPTLLTSGR